MSRPIAPPSAAEVEAAAKFAEEHIAQDNDRAKAQEAEKRALYDRAVALGLEMPMQTYHAIVRTLKDFDRVSDARSNLATRLQTRMSQMDSIAIIAYLTNKKDAIPLSASTPAAPAPATIVVDPGAARLQTFLEANEQLFAELRTPPKTPAPQKPVAREHRLKNLGAYSISRFMEHDVPLAKVVVLYSRNYKAHTHGISSYLEGAIHARLIALGAETVEADELTKKIADQAQGRNTISDDSRSPRVKKAGASRA